METVWFVAIAVLWTGYLVLDGFDFGLGALLPVLGRDDADRRVMINAIGPVWDGNEVWLITAVAAMFAAFPAWYAATLSGFYLPVLCIVLALVGRGVAFEYRAKGDSAAWRARWDAVIVVGSVVPAFGWGVVFANLLRGVELGPDGVVTSSLTDLLSPYALLGGLALLSLCVLHGAVFTALKTDGPVRHRARRIVPVLAAVAVPAVAGFAGWTAGPPAAAIAAMVLVAAVALAVAGREGWAFTATALAVAGFAVLLFGTLYPDLLPSRTGTGLTVSNAASGEYTLTLLSWIGAAALPVVIAYQSWSYWVFRRRVTRAQITS